MTAAIPLAYRLKLNVFLAVGLLVLAAACGTAPPQRGSTGSADGPPAYPVDLATIADAVPQVEPPSRYGNPTSYVVFDQRYDVMSSSSGYVERGIASWYGTKFHGKRTSSGEAYDMYAMTAAHKTLPIPTYAEVTNLVNGRRVVVKINDRGPFKENRLIDLSYAAASKLGITNEGTGIVQVRALDPATYAGEPMAVDPPDVSPSRPGLYLQLGAFSQMENAVRLRARLDGRIQEPIRVVRTEGGQQPLYRVRIGPLEDVEEADRVSRNLMGMGFEALVVVD